MANASIGDVPKEPASTSGPGVTVNGWSVTALLIPVTLVTLAAVRVYVPDE